VALRRERLALALALAVGDLAGALPLMRVVEELSGFADRALDAAIAAAIARRAPDAEPVGFSAIALGKHGAQELNYSSDIDPILLYDPEVLPRRARDEPGEAAQRVARGVVELLSTITDEGYVFRIDLRLRPASEVSPLAIPLKGRSPIMNRAPWRGSGRPISAPAPRLAMWRAGRPSSTRSARSCGGAAWISARLPRSGG
jgi:glutamate-ammonia-ligase adenylyltransferase